jgi:hypothetical protein
MSKQTFPIDEGNMEAVKSHIRQQFDKLSWWPAEEPSKAKEEFECLRDAPESLLGWCEKWLDGGQWRKLKKAIKD